MSKSAEGLNNIFTLPPLLLDDTYTYKNVLRFVLEYFSCLSPIMAILSTGCPVLRHFFHCGSLINLAWDLTASQSHG
jgi:hypothetical protein